MVLTGGRKRGHQEDDSSDNTPTVKRAKMEGNLQQDRDAETVNEALTSLEPLASSIPTTAAIPASSKRQGRRAAVLAKTGDIGCNDKAKGVVRIHEGILQHFLKRSETWVPAIHHNDIRAELIAESEALGDYDHPRARGLAEHDVTSFHLMQKTWGIERQDWPEVLFQIIPDKGTQLAADKVKPWYRDGKILLDQDNNPVKDFVDIPATLSSEFEGQYMEAMCRLDSRIKQADFRARMPNMMIPKAGEPAVPLFTLNTISMRMSRFRDQAALISREKRAGSKALETNLRNLLPEQCFKDNSTKSFGRLLTPKEIADVKSINKGKFGYRAHKDDDEGAAGVSKTTGPSRKRTRTVVEDNHDEQNFEFPTTRPRVKRSRRGDNHDEQNSELDAITPSFPQVKRSRRGDDHDEQNSEFDTMAPSGPRVNRSRRGEVQEPDWSAVIDPTLDLTNPWLSDDGNQNQQPQAPAHTQPWNHAENGFLVGSGNAYSIDPQQEFALAGTGDQNFDPSINPFMRSDMGISQFHMPINGGGLVGNQYGNPFMGTSAMEFPTARDHRGDTGRNPTDIYGPYHNFTAALTESPPHQRFQNTANMYGPYDRDLAANTAITTGSAIDDETAQHWDMPRNGDFSRYGEPSYGQWDHTYAYPVQNRTAYNNGNGQHEPEERLDPADQALENVLLSELGRSNADEVTSGPETVATGADRNISFTNDLFRPDPRYENQEYVTFGDM